LTAVLGVVCALRSEARHLGRTLSKNPHVEAFADGRLLALTGMGPLAAAAGSETLISCGATALMSFGLAGALDPSLRPGSVFLPGVVTDRTGVALATDAHWLAHLTARAAASSTGTLLSVAHPVAATTDKATLFAATGARAVDMESFGVAQVARAAGVPFVATRVIVDAAGDSVPTAVLAATDSNGHTSVWRLVRGLSRDPRELAALVRLALGYRRASRSLATLARTLVCGSLVSSSA
jgi:adenosylhomocysteine nucleosidase